LPVILQRTAAQELMLGSDYPLFVSSTAEVLPLIRELLTDPDLYQRAARTCRAAAERFTYANVFRDLKADVDALVRS
ncbi:MAG: hypothetical protein ACXVIJ_12180, partial [Thermoanaerobaculia bacterium]